MPGGINSTTVPLCRAVSSTLRSRLASTGGPAATARPGCCRGSADDSRLVRSTSCKKATSVQPRVLPRVLVRVLRRVLRGGPQGGRGRGADAGRTRKQGGQGRGQGRGKGREGKGAKGGRARPRPHPSPPSPVHSARPPGVPSHRIWSLKASMATYVERGRTPVHSVARLCSRLQATEHVRTPQPGQRYCVRRAPSPSQPRTVSAVLAPFAAAPAFAYLGRSVRADATWRPCLGRSARRRVRLLLHARLVRPRGTRAGRGRERGRGRGRGRGRVWAGFASFPGCFLRRSLCVSWTTSWTLSLPPSVWRTLCNDSATNFLV